MITRVFSIFSVIVAALVLAGSGVAQTAVDAAMESVVTILIASDTDERPVGSGIVVRSDGYILTAHSLVKGARDIRIRLRNGETYDKAEIVAADDRRNVAILRIAAAGLRTMPYGTSEEAQVGSRVAILANPAGQGINKAEVTLRSVQMADNVVGAGRGYRLLEVDQTSGAAMTGGLIVDEVGRSIGIVTTTPDVKAQNIGVPMSSVLGLIRSTPVAARTTEAVVLPGTATVNRPLPIPQSSVLVPERGVTPLRPAGPGSVVVRPKTIPEVLAVSKTVYVRSRTVSFKPDQIINALNKEKGWAEFGLAFVDDPEVADLVLELDHVLFTWKYTFKLYSQRLGVVVATGDRIIWDGNLGADAMADRVVEKLKAAGGPEKKPNVSDDKQKGTSDTKSKTDKN